MSLPLGRRSPVADPRQGDVPSAYHALMSISLAEFARLLPATLLPGQALQAPSGDGREYLIHWGAGRIRLRLAPESALQIASLSLQRQRLSIDFKGLDAAQRSEWLGSFQIKFQRGGG